MSAFRDKIAELRFPERTVPVCFRHDLMATLQALEKKLTEVSDEGMEKTQSVAIATQIEQVREAMKEATYDFRLRGLPVREYRALKAKYPPRQGEDGKILSQDDEYDANVDEWAGPLIRACLVDPIIATDAEWEEVERALTDGQFDVLAGVAVAVNRGGVGVPLSPGASKILKDSEND
jgi:hypothetical protein